MRTDTFDAGSSISNRDIGGRLGVAILDTAGMRPVAHRGSERFALCSTSKLFAAAFVLTRVDRGQESLTRRVVYGMADLVSHSLITEAQASRFFTRRPAKDAEIRGIGPRLDRRCRERAT
jgi:beta-lactamase class A